MIMSDSARTKQVMKGFSAVAAASLFALAQGCATQPGQSGQSPADYAQAGSQAADSGPTDGMQDQHDSGAKKAGHHQRRANPYFRTTTSTSEG